MPRPSQPEETTVADLRARLARMERGGRGAVLARGLGDRALDSALPAGGLPLGCVHEVVCGDAGRGGAGTAFAALLARRTAAGRGPVVWCLRAGHDDTLFAPGLAALGLGPDDLLLVRAADDAGVLWSQEEALRCPAVGAAVGQPGRLDLTAARRLQLAAEAGGATGVVLRRPAPGRRGAAGTSAPGVPAGAATTRWRVDSRPGRPAPWGGLGPARWLLTLERCRGALPRAWTVEWNDDSGDLRVVADLPDRPADPPPGSPCPVA